MKENEKEISSNKGGHKLRSDFWNTIVHNAFKGMCDCDCHGFCYMNPKCGDAIRTAMAMKKIAQEEEENESRSGS